MMKLSYRFLGILVALAIGTTMAACAEESQMRKQLLEQTPLGSDMSKVNTFCVEEKLKCKRSETAGYLDQKTGKVVGVKSMWALLSEKKESPMSMTSISAYWGFDKEGRLVDIWVWKTIDAP